MPIPMAEEKPLPCVIYCHGNSGCRADASEAAVILLPSNITVFSLDFSGSGLSEGEYVTLGWNEKDDLKAVVEHLRTDKRVSCIGLWGRSMGAVTSLMYGAEDPSIAGMVLDSPFSNLVELMMELVDVYKVRLPKFTLKVAIQYMRKIIQRKAHFDILELDAIKVAKKSFIPALFGHAAEDSFIQPHHSDLIYKAYMGDKNIIKFEGDHNTPRPRFYYDSINIFFHNVLQPPEDPVAELTTNTSFIDTDDFMYDNESIGYQVLMAMQPSFLPPDLSGFRPDISNSSDSDSAWQISHSEVPSDLDGFQSDLSKLLEKGNLDAGIDGGLSPQSLLNHGNVDESSSRGPHNEMIHEDTWDSSFLQEFSEPLCQEIFADFPSTVEDEERMINEAIAASLQETNINNCHPKEGNSPSVETSTSSPSSSTLPSHGTVSTVSSTDDQASSNGSIPGKKGDEQPASMEPHTVGTLEALGQRWGLGIFRSMSNKHSSNNQS
ncbi:hypothetical protein KP509_13G024000 [Ceratopteris richardii]|nr:hypothetical protein KP509_13G024000 [Ceratopteris richardii]